MASLFKSLSGVSVPHRKHTEDSATQTMPVPDVVSIVMSQHMGPPCDVMVAPGDTVKVGQVLGNSEAFLSAPIHSSVSGTVKGIDQIIMPNGTRSKAVVIETDKEQTLHEDIAPPQLTDRASFLAAAKNAGLVGLGGAGFPTHIKFNPKNLDEVDTLVVNAAECEPYITSDYRTILEDLDDVLEGIRLIMQYLEIAHCVIGIEDNKPKAIKALQEAVRDRAGVEVKVLRSKYPQGAEKVLIYECTGRIVGEGKLPADVGVIVSNVTTIACFERYLRTGVPLIAKRITVDGQAVKNPGNIVALIGTPIKDVIEFCGGFRCDPDKILMGGPMMGLTVYDLTYPVLKNNNAILAFSKEEAQEFLETDCIRCGRCVRACPVKLMPLRIEDSFLREDLQGLKDYKVNLCMECGCCSFVCPARRHLVQVNRLSKAKLRNADKPA